ncbi:MAG: hypothetical protein KF784_13090 [Fimbriimonadaceae bacterium]|nr:hypothetical protein [Fimbriimonadaceae bacterium]
METILPAVIEETRPRRKWTDLLWLGGAVAFLLTLLISFEIWSPSRGSAPHDIVSKVPLGIHVSELDPYLIRGHGSTGVVTEWTEKTTESYTGRVPMKNTKYGKFKTRGLGNYDTWKKTIDRQDRFTGEITFTHESFWSTDVNSFYFKDGVLVDKDWGFLPG